MLRQMLKRPVETTEPWCCPVLAKDREQARRITDTLTALEREWEALERRTDFGADKRREELRALMPPLYQQRDDADRRVAQGVEREVVVNETRPLHDAELAAQRAIAEDFVNTVTAPSPEAVRALAARVRTLNNLRRQLHSATNDRTYAVDIDVLLEVRDAWEQQAAARRKHFTHTLAPGSRHVALPSQPWDELVARLKELRPSSTREEIAHVR